MTNMRLRDASGIAASREGYSSFCPLSQLKAGAACRIKQICAAADICQRLREIGFCEEQIVKRLPNQTSVICQVCNARLAVSVVLAELILVEPIEEPLEMALGA